jgi:hypothetical protein
MILECSSDEWLKKKTSDKENVVMDVNGIVSSNNLMKNIRSRL